MAIRPVSSSMRSPRAGLAWTSRSAASTPTTARSARSARTRPTARAERNGANLFPPTLWIRAAISIPPEFSAMHDHGNNQTVFNRLDYQPDENDSIHLNLFFSRAWFQTPNTYDQQTAGQDQRERILSYNIAPGWVHLINANSTFTLTPYIRNDEVVYTPSRESAGRSARDGFAVAAADQSRRQRRITPGSTTTTTSRSGAGAAYVPDREVFAGNHRSELRSGERRSRTCALRPDAWRASFPLLRTHGYQGICRLLSGQHYTGKSVDTGGTARGFLSRIGSGKSAEPRIGLSYLVKPTNTVFRLSYSKFYETPYNENLLVSSFTGQGGLAGNVFGAYGDQPLKPGTRISTTRAFSRV